MNGAFIARFFCTICIVMICSGQLAAQYGTFYGSFTPNDKPHYIGEEDTVGTFSVSSYQGCTIMSFYESYGGIFSYHYSYPYSGTSRIYGFVTYTPTTTSTVTSSTKFSVGYGYGGGCYGNGYDSCYITASAAGTSDSVFRIRPTYLPVSMKTDTPGKKWTAHIQFNFDNNTSSPATIGGWKVSDDTLEYSVQAFYKGNAIASYTAQPHERTIPIDFEISLKRGPIYSNVIQRRGRLECHVTQDAEEKTTANLLLFTIPAAPYKFLSRLDRDSLLFTNAPNTSESRKIFLHVDPTMISYSISSFSHPFSVVDNYIDDTTRELTITCSPKSGGTYPDNVQIKFITADFNGDPREDSLYLKLTSVASIENDAQFWVPAGSPDIEAVKLGGSSHGVYAATGKKLYVSRNSGNMWKNIPISDSICTAFVVDTEDNVYRITDGQSIALLPKTGTSWRSSSPIGIANCTPCNYSMTTPPSFPLKVLNLTLSQQAIYCAAIGSYFWYCGFHDECESITEGTFILNNGDFSWRQLSDYHTLGKGYADSAGNNILISGRHFKYLPFNYSWDAPDSITAFATDASGNLIAYALGSGFFYSTDNGFSWTHEGLAFPDVRAIVTAPTGEIFIVVKDCGVYRSTDQGRNWEGINGGLLSKKVNDIIAIPGEPLYLATDDFWVWRSTWIVPLNSDPRLAPLNPNLLFDLYPNPAQSQLSINYSIPKGQTAHLTIMNLLGEELGITDKDKSLEGANTLTVDLSHLPNGIYFCRLQSQTGVIVKKMLHY